MDIRRTGNGKYYDSWSGAPYDNNSTRMIYVNLDSNEKTIEEVIRFKALKNRWSPTEFLVSKGFIPYLRPSTEYKVMDDSLQEKINQEFLYECQFFEPDRFQDIRVFEENKPLEYKK